MEAFIAFAYRIFILQVLILERHFWARASLCPHTYIHTYTHIHTCIHTYLYMHTYIHSYMHTYTHTYVHTYLRTLRTYIHIHTYIQTCIHIHNKYICIHVYTHVHTYIHNTYIHNTYIHRYIVHSYTHTHTLTHTLNLHRSPYSFGLCDVCKCIVVFNLRLFRTIYKRCFSAENNLIATHIFRCTLNTCSVLGFDVNIRYMPL